MLKRIAQTTALVVLAGQASIAFRASQAPVDLYATVDELIWWLPADSETVQVTQTPAQPRGPLFDAMETARGEIAFGDVAYADTMARHLKIARVKATVEGSRRFLPPSGLGQMRHDGALIILFDKPLDGAGAALLADLEKIALKIEQLEGLKVVEFRDEIESDTWASYITMPRSDVLVVATDHAYLEEVLRRRGSRAANRALPADLPEWRRVDTTAPFWAVRHYRREGAGEDPTSPFTRTRNGEILDAAAVGVTVHTSPDGRTIVAHYLSRATSAEQIVHRLWHHAGDGVAPALRRVGDDTIEARFTANDEEDVSMCFFYLLAALGHATYL